LFKDGKPHLIAGSPGFMSSTKIRTMLERSAADADVLNK